MDRLEEIVYPLLWTAPFTAAGRLFPGIMPVAILATVILGISCIRMLLVRRLH